MKKDTFTQHANIRIDPKSKPILLIDQDDVIVDFFGAAVIDLRKNPAIKFPQSQYKFFEKLQPIKGAIESIKMLQEHFDVCILTRPSVHNPLCYTEKRVSIETHLGFEICVNLILCYDKTMVMGDYLVDDSIHTGRFKPVWEHIHFGTIEYPDWESVLKYLM